jgi:hypothetical protein
MDAAFKWVDVILDTEQSTQAVVTLPEEPSKAEYKWSSLPQPDVIVQDTTVLPTQHGFNKQNESDRGPPVVRATTRDTMMPMATSGTGLTRKKKRRLDKNCEQFNGRKRARNRALLPTKAKN